MTVSFSQIAHYIFTHAHSTIAALDLEIKNSLGYSLRPTTFPAIDKLFPKGLYDDAWATAKGCSTNTSTQDTDVTAEFFKIANVGSKDLRLEIKRFAEEILARHKAIGHPNRAHAAMSLRACSVTTTNWPSASTNIVRDFSFFCKVGLIEHYLLEHVQYRQPLLNTALGEVRNALHGILDSCVEEYTMRHPRTQQVIQVKSWLFIDMLDTPQDARANAVDRSSFIAAARRAEAQSALASHVRALKEMVQNHPSSWVATRQPDVDVERNLDALLSAVYANGERQIQCDHPQTTCPGDASYDSVERQEGDHPQTTCQGDAIYDSVEPVRQHNLPPRTKRHQTARTHTERVEDRAGRVVERAGSAHPPTQPPPAQHAEEPRNDGDIYKHCELNDDRPIRNDAPIPTWVDFPNWPLRLARLSRIERNATVDELLPMMISAGLMVPPTLRHLRSHYQAYLEQAISIATQKSQTHTANDSPPADSSPPQPAHTRSRKRSSRANVVAGKFPISDDHMPLLMPCRQETARRLTVYHCYIPNNVLPTIYCSIIAPNLQCQCRHVSEHSTLLTLAFQLFGGRPILVTGIVRFPALVPERVSRQAISARQPHPLASMYRLTLPALVRSGTPQDSACQASSV